MASRDDEKQSLHDKAIEYYSEEYFEEDNIVKADHIDGYDQPESLNGEIPDILLVGTTKQGGKTAFEIETDGSDDKEQRKNLREWARNHQGRTFRWGIVEEYPPDIDWQLSVDK